ncbi:alpha/beta fold hydrolase [Salinarimonas sp.]|uniref:alpha/beta fold hydrolase n=1 Tax=Salinarimonas sp. TaxID=2766526 RepID=UPI0032D9851C
MTENPEPLLLVPGMLCDARLYGPQIAALSGMRSVSVPTIAHADSVAALAASILAEAPPRFALAGLSMGGIVAMEVVRQAPDRVTRLALLDTNPLGETDKVRAAREPQIEEALAGGLEAVIRRDMWPVYLHAESERQDIRDLALAMALAQGAEVFARQSRALQTRPDQQETLRAYRGPTLILCGEDDRLCPVKRHTLMHELMPGSTLTIVPGAGHLPTLETPEAVNAAMAAWLAG